jgi:hypothetical protein
MPLVEIIAVGALVKPEGDDMVRPKQHGDRVHLSEEDARVLVANGTAEIVEQGVADDAEEEQPMGGVFDLSKLTIPELRQWADDRRIRLTGARTRPEILGMIQAALANPEAGDQIVAATINPHVAATAPLANPEAAEPGGPASSVPAEPADMPDTGGGGSDAK